MKLFFVIAIFLVIFGSAQSTPVNSADSDWKWIDWNSKSENIPENSVQGGVNPQGRPLYVARVPGAAVEDEREFVYGSCGATDGKSDDDCFFSNDTEEKKVHDVQVRKLNFNYCKGFFNTQFLFLILDLSWRKLFLVPWS